VSLIMMDDAPAECLAWLTEQFISDNPVPRIVVASSEFHLLEWPVREAGGIFLDDESSRTEIARLCLRLLKHIRRTPSSAGCR
jgi:hypothetical protein